MRAKGPGKTHFNPMNIKDSSNSALSSTSRDEMAVSLTMAAPEEGDMEGKAFGCLTSDSAFRQACYAFFKSRWTGALVMVGISANIVVLALQGPRHKLGHDFDHFVDVFDVGLTILFTLEAIAGSCALGFISGHKAYLKDPWNALDFGVLVGIMGAYVILWVSDTNIEVAAVRAFRALRPLRSLRLFAGLQGILDALVMTLPYVMSILGMLVFFLMIFSTAGIALFGGALVTECETEPQLCRLPQVAVALGGSPICSDTILVNQTASWEAPFELSQVVCPINFACDWCNSIPLSGSGAYPWDGEYGMDRWLENEFIGFDNVLQASLTLFVVTTMDEWTLISHRLTASSADTAGTAWTFITLVVLCLALITANLFVAVVVFGFGKMRKERQKSAFTGADWAETVAQKAEAESAEDSQPLQENQTLSTQQSALETASYARYMDLKPFPFLPGASPVLHKVVQSSIFELSIIAVIVANAVAMASEYHGMSKVHRDLLWASEIVFLTIFIIEMLLKWFGLGIGLSGVQRESKTGYFQDTFNCFDFMLVFVSIVGLIAESMSEGASSGRVVRILFRMFRIARLLRLMKGQSSLYMLLQTVLSSWEAIANLCIFIIFTMVVFAVIGMHTMGFMCHGEDSGEIPRVNFASFSGALLTCFQVMTGEDWAPIMYYYMHCSNPVGAAGYFLIVCSMTCFVLLSLFVAVILENFALADDAKKKMQREKYEGNILQRSAESLGEVVGRSVLQQRCKLLAESVWFERFILAVIVVSSVAMAMEKPPQAALDSADETYAAVLEALGFAFLSIFVVECLIKVVAYDFVGHEQSYWSDPWNRLDFSVVVLGLVDVIVYMASGKQSSVTRIFRLFRVLRPLRLIKRNAGMTVIVNSLISCIPMVTGVVALISLLFVMFAIVGMNLFMGMFFSCAENPLGPALTNATLLDMLQCDSSGGVWDNHNFYNFDNVFEAFKTLFIVSTTEGWVTVMQTAFDIPSQVGGAPVRDNNLGAAWFFVPFMVFSAFFSANLFIGVLANYFGRSSGNTLMTSSQRQWVQMHMLSMQLQPDPVVPPTNGFRLACYKIAMHKSVETVVSGAIVANTVILMAEHYPMDSTLLTAFDSINMVFLVIFTIELTIKLIGMGWRGYFKYSNWNALDASIVFLSWFAYAAEGLSVFSGGRALRVLRLLLLLRNTATLQTLLRTLILSLPPALNITTLLLLVLFVFGIIGIQLFGGLPHGALNIAAINEYDNFDSIVPAMRVLFQIATGQDFVSKAEDLQIRMGDAGYFGKRLVMPYLVVYYITSVFIFINLFVAVLLENFELNFDPDALDVKPADLEHFKEAWEQHAPTPQATRMPISDVRGLVQTLQGVLGEIMVTDKLWWNHLLVKLDWNIADPLTSEHTTGFHQLLFALALMHVSLDALPLEERVKAAAEFKEHQQATAARTIRACVACYLRLKHPARYMTDDLKQAKRKNPRGFDRRLRSAMLCSRQIMVIQIASVSKLKSMEHDAELQALVALQARQRKAQEAKLLSTEIEIGIDDDDDNDDDDDGAPMGGGIVSRRATKKEARRQQKALSRKKEPQFHVNPMLEVTMDN